MRRELMKQFCTRMFEALGPFAVECGLEAEPNSWYNCFLALAYGVPGELRKDSKGECNLCVIQGRFEVSHDDAQRFMKLFDNNLWRGRLLAFADEWLELNTEKSDDPRRNPDPQVTGEDRQCAGVDRQATGQARPLDTAGVA